MEYTKRISSLFATQFTVEKSDCARCVYASLNTSNPVHASLYTFSLIASTRVRASLHAPNRVDPGDSVTLGI